MKLVSIIITLLLVTGVITLFNTFNLFGVQSQSQDLMMNHESVEGIALVDSSTNTGTENWWEANIPGAQYISWMFKAVAFIWEALQMTLQLGALVEIWVPGDVGVAFGFLINGIIWFFIGWSVFQIYMKVSTKYMD